MKYFFLFAALSAFVFASAQSDALHYFQKKMNKLNKPFLLPEYQPPVSLQPQQNYISSKKEHSYILPDGNKVTILAQDNMPCIMPDMKEFNMPNMGSPEMLYPHNATIPNAGLNQKYYSYPSLLIPGIKNSKTK